MMKLERGGEVVAGSLDMFVLNLCELLMYDAMMILS